MVGDVSAPLQVPVAVLEEARPVLDALARLHIDVGSVTADRLYPDAPPDMRLLCVAWGEPLDHLACALRHELLDDPAALALTNRVAILPLPLDNWLVIFPEIVAIETT
jgi:hypothetical protein